MDENVNRATYIGVALTVIVTLATAVALTLTLGRGMLNDFTESMIDVLGIRGGTVKSIDDEIISMSAASAQLLVAQNYSNIDLDESELKVKLYGDSELTDLGLITTRAHGDVLVEVRKITSGRYKVKIHSYDCNIRKFDGTCNCSSCH